MSPWPRHCSLDELTCPRILTIPYSKHREWYHGVDEARTMAGGEVVPIRCADGSLKRVWLSFDRLKYTKPELGVIRLAHLREAEDAEAVAKDKEGAGAVG